MSEIGLVRSGRDDKPNKNKPTKDDRAHLGHHMHQAGQTLIERIPVLRVLALYGVQILQRVHTRVVEVLVLFAQTRRRRVLVTFFDCLTGCASISSQRSLVTEA